MQRLGPSWQATSALAAYVIAAVAIWASCVGAAEGPTTRPAGGAKAGVPWRGIHLSLSRRRLGPLVRELPALAKMGVNVLVVEVNYNFAYASHPELRSGTDAITKADARGLAAACRKLGIRLIPQFQCLGHQSWRQRTFPLLAKHPDLDETPGQFPRNKGIYCRSWCPLHPKVNPIVFALMDELLDAFAADALHVGMDEVFLIASKHCPRCKGKRPAELFAQAVNDYHGHLVKKRKVEMLMWGDRLIPLRLGYGRWESSDNATAGAIDRIPTDIILCDWHYRKRKDYPSVPLLLKKGFRVWPAGWKDPAATEALIASAARCKSRRMLGHLCTTWGRAVPPNLHKFPPVLAAMRKLGGIEPPPAGR